MYRSRTTKNTCTEIDLIYRSRHVPKLSCTESDVTRLTTGLTTGWMFVYTVQPLFTGVVTQIILERIQHRFTRFFNDLRDLDYAERLRRLGLWTLEERRNRVDLIEVYKIVNGLSNLPVSTFFEFRTDTRTRGHSLKLNKR